MPLSDEETASAEYYISTRVCFKEFCIFDSDDNDSVS